MMLVMEAAIYGNYCQIISNVSKRHKLIVPLIWEFLVGNVEMIEIVW